MTRNRLRGGVKRKLYPKRRTASHFRASSSPRDAPPAASSTIRTLSGIGPFPFLKTYAASQRSEGDTALMFRSFPRASPSSFLNAQYFIRLLSSRMISPSGYARAPCRIGSNTSNHVAPLTA